MGVYIRNINFISNINYISYRSVYKEKSRDIAVSALEGGDDLLSRFRSTSGPKIEARSLTSLLKR